MSFISIPFLIFLPIVVILYWYLIKERKLQNAFLMLVSYIFYGWVEWRFLILILISTIVDFVVGYMLKCHQDNPRRKVLLGVSILVNLGLLFYFKYSNFFIESFNDALTLLGFRSSLSTLKVILPVGISFYTFQTMSYSIDVYKRKIEPTQDFFAFGAYVSFFPQLVAGPIERASHLLPQFQKKRKFDYLKAVDGTKQMLWGFFKKVVVADNVAELVDWAFENYSDANGSTLLFAAFLFSIQIYADFSAYSDIAIGTARIFGFDLKRNFAFPYFSRNIAEFWRRWHISLTSWFRDYLYIPLGGSKAGRWKHFRNVAIIFLVSGFWHGANWTYIVWGAFHAFFFIILMLFNAQNNYRGEIIAHDSFFPKIKEVAMMIWTFALVTLTWVFFRAPTLAVAVDYIQHIFTPTLLEKPHFDVSRGGTVFPLKKIALVFFIFMEWYGRRGEYAIQNLWLSKPPMLRYLFYVILTAFILIYFGQEKPFIYFQF